MKSKLRTKSNWLVFGWLALLVLASFQLAFAATPNITNYQGRLEDTSGNAIGGNSGTNFDFKFSIWDTSATSTGTRLWPASAPASTTFKVTNGVFDARIGDTSQGFAALTLDFNTSSIYYLEVAVYNTSTAAFETLSPRQAIVSTGFAINADTVDGSHASTSPNSVLKLDPSGGINLPNGSSTFAGSLIINGSSFAVASAVTSTSLVFLQGTSVGSTTLNLLGVTNQTANLLTISSSTGVNLFTIGPTGVASSSEFRSPSSTIGTLTVTTCTGCGGFSSGVDSQILFGQLGGGATSSLLFTISTSTGIVSISSSSLGTASGTNISVTGYGLFPQMQFTGASGTNIGISTASTSILTFTNASGSRLDLTGGLTFTYASSTGNVTLGGSNTQILNQLTFANASSTNLDVATRFNFGAGSSTGAFTFGSTLQANAGQTTLGSASSTNFQASGYGTFPTLNFTNASGTNLSASGFLQSGSLNITGSGASSTPSAITFLGTPLGTSTRSLVQFGPNPIQAGSTTGTYLGINVGTTSFFGDFVNFQVVSSTKFSISASGVASSTEFRSPSSTIGTLTAVNNLLDFNGNKYSTSTAFTLSSGVDSQILFGQLGGGATSSLAFTFTSSTSAFLFSGSNFSIAPSATSTSLAFLQGAQTGSTTLNIFGAANQTANLLSIASSTGISLFNINSIGQVAIATNTYPASSTLFTVASSSQIFMIDAGGGIMVGTSTVPNGVIFTIATSSPIFLANLNGSVMIGTSTAPGNALLTIATSSNIFTVLNNGHVGIGTSSPGFALTVDSTSGVDIFTVDPITQNPNFILEVQSSSSVDYFTIAGATGVASSSEFRTPSSTIQNLADFNGNKYSTSTAFNLSSAGVDSQILFGQLGGSATSSLLIQQNGSSTLGIGGVAASTTALVFLQNTVASTATSTLLLQGSANQIGNLLTVSSSTGTGNLFLINSIGQIAVATSAFPASSTLLTVASSSQIFNINYGGNVMIGTSTAPNAALLTIATTSNIFTVLSNGNVGIGTTAPTSTLNIFGAVAQTASLFTISSNTGNPFFNINAIGQVAIATNTYPASSTLFTVASSSQIFNINYGGNVMIGTSTAPNGVLFTVATSSQIFNIGAGGNVMVGTSTAANGMIFTIATSSPIFLANLRGSVMIGTSTAPGNALLTIATSTNIFTVLSNGNVGIATTTPAYALTVDNSGGADTFFVDTVTANPDFILDVQTSSSVRMFGVSSSSWGIFPSTTGGLVIGTSTNPISSVLFGVATGTQMFAINQNGWAGIGTQFPSSTLHVIGSTNQINDLFTVSTSTGSTFLTINSVGQILVATSSAPASSTLLAIATSSNIFTVSNNGLIAMPSTGGGLAIATSGLYGATTTLTVCARTNCTAPTTASSTNAVAFFASTGGGTANGSIIARGTITSGMSDIGEFIDVVGNESDYRAGDVLIASPNNPKKFEKSHKPYDKNLTGVVTETAGLIAGGGEDSHGSTVIALAGRVPIKVNAENGDIKVGDYLTASSQEGIAMKAVKAGRVLAVALEPYSFGTQASTSTPKVLAFVNPHWESGSLIEGLAISSSSSDTDFAEKVLTKFMAQSTSASSTNISEIFTDRIGAGLEIITPKVVANGLVVESIGGLNGKINVTDDVFFFGRPYLNSDSGGFAVVGRGEKSVDITFDREYVAQPVVNTNIALEAGANAINIANSIFTGGINYLITNKSTKGFTIAINNPAPDDITFNWIALAIKDAKTFTLRSQAPVQNSNSAGTGSGSPGNGSGAPSSASPDMNSSSTDQNSSSTSQTPSNSNSSSSDAGTSSTSTVPTVVNSSASSTPISPPASSSSSSSQTSQSSQSPSSQVNPGNSSSTGPSSPQTDPGSSSPAAATGGSVAPPSDASGTTP